MSGVPFRVDGKGRVLVSWMSRNKVYWSLSPDGGRRFGPAVRAPEGGEQGGSVALMNPEGEVLLVWKEGGLVNWATYTQDGKPTGDRGSAGRLPDPNKPTAFVGPDGAFYIAF
jgi:hypothetical protein